MKEIIIKLVATNSGWIARRLIMYGAVFAAVMTTWLTAKGVSADLSTAIAGGVVSAVLGCIELALSFIARKYKVPEADGMKQDIDKLRSGGVPMIVAGLCLLVLTSCTGLTAFFASAPGQVLIVTAEQLTKQLASAEVEKELVLVIETAEAKIALLKAKGVQADLVKEAQRQAELVLFGGIAEAAQNQYVGMTGHRYSLPKNPVTVTAA